jgi:predicted TIM-barrel fold metal-dependent hydrolase
VTTIGMTDESTIASEAAPNAPVMAFSVDSHVGPPMEILRPYCPKNYLEAFDEFTASEQAAITEKAEFFERLFSDKYRHGRQRNAQTAGHYDPHTRLRDMDRDGVSGGVIFHDSLNGEPFPFDLTNSLGNGIPLPEARELAAIGRGMYNRWLADFCSVEPERAAGLAQLPFWDIDATIKELEWCAENGLRGVNFPAPGQGGMLQPGDPMLDPFFAACAALDMTLATHIGATPPRPESAVELSGSLHFGLIDTVNWGTRVVYMLCIFGVFERYPNLKLVLTEHPGVFWNEMVLRMDSVYYSPQHHPNPMVSRPPSEYMASNVWIGNSFQSRQEAVDAIEIGREDRFLWGSDYPHPEGTYTYPEDPEQYPMTKVALANTYHDLPLEKVRRLVGANALDAYPRLDGAALGQVAERVGIRVNEISTAPDLNEYPYINDTGTLAFRTFGPWA